MFRNSFDQPSQYLYGGKLWRPIKQFPYAHVKLTAGLILGYTDEAEDAVPLNQNGIGLAILPAIGLSGRRFSTDLVFYSLNGVMWTIGIYLD